MTQPKKEAPKEMISVSEKNNKTYVKINFSSLDIINTCLRKTFYSLEKGYRNTEPSPALIMGSAIHKALEVWYLSDPAERIVPTNANDNGLKVALGHLDPPPGSVFFAAIKGFAEVMEPVKDTPASDKRSIDNGIKILVEYFKRYKDDGMEVLCDSEGLPYVERLASHVMYDSSDLQITYFGTVDVILQNKQTGIVAVTDHKTTAALGTQFYNRLKPNHQYTGYLWLAQKELLIDTRMFMINGIQIAKTKQDFARQFTERDESDFQELENAVVGGVKRYLEARETGVWTQNAPQPCTMYGSCSYLRVCEVNPKLRENVISSLWENSI